VHDRVDPARVLLVFVLVHDLVGRRPVAGERQRHGLAEPVLDFGLLRAGHPGEG